MSKLSTLIANVSVPVKEMAISAVGSMALVAQSAFEPYFIPVCNTLTPLLSLTEPEMMCLRGKFVPMFAQAVAWSRLNSVCPYGVDALAEQLKR
jgi:hypothetical protein